MNIQFNADEQHLEELRTIYVALDLEEAIFMNHYQLAKDTGIPSDRWKEFLLHPKVSLWISAELDLYRAYQLRRMIKDATDDKRSVGAAQMMNALNKSTPDTGLKDGPIIIYTHVPMTPAQQAASTTQYVQLEQNILENIPDEWED